MNTKLQTIFSEAEGRYLADDEVSKLDEYASSVRRRLQAMKTIEAAEDRIVDSALEQAFPQLPDEMSSEKYQQKCHRDVRLVLRYCTMAMVRDDESLLTDKLLYWLRTILQSFFARKCMDVTYRELADSCQRHLDGDALELIAPYIKLTHEILTAKR